MVLQGEMIQELNVQHIWLLNKRAINCIGYIEAVHSPREASDPVSSSLNRLYSQISSEEAMDNGGELPVCSSAVSFVTESVVSFLSVAAAAAAAMSLAGGGLPSLFFPDGLPEVVDVGTTASPESQVAAVDVDLTT